MQSDPNNAALPPPGDGTKPQPAGVADETPPVDPGRPRRKDVHPDPTRYGDWERKGRCIDF